MSLSEQVKETESVALVKLLDIQQYGSPAEKVLIVEVVDGIYNLKKGEKLRLLGKGNLLGIDIGFNELNSEAIIFMNKIKPPFEYQGFYNTTSVENSVFHKKGGKVSGYKLSPISYKGAVIKIRKELEKRERFERILQ